MAAPTTGQGSAASDNLRYYPAYPGDLERLRKNVGATDDTPDAEAIRTAALVLGLRNTFDDTVWIRAVSTALDSPHPVGFTYNGHEMVVRNLNMNGYTEVLFSEYQTVTDLLLTRFADRIGPEGALELVAILLTEYADALSGKDAVLASLKLERDAFKQGLDDATSDIQFLKSKLEPDSFAGKLKGQTRAPDDTPVDYPLYFEQGTGPKPRKSFWQSLVEALLASVESFPKGPELAYGVEQEDPNPTEAPVDYPQASTAVDPIRAAWETVGYEFCMDRNSEDDWQEFERIVRPIVSTAYANGVEDGRNQPRETSYATPDCDAYETGYKAAQAHYESTNKQLLETVAKLRKEAEARAEGMVEGVIESTSIVEEWIDDGGALGGFYRALILSGVPEKFARDLTRVRMMNDHDFREHVFAVTSR